MIRDCGVTMPESNSGRGWLEHPLERVGFVDLRIVDQPRDSGKRLGAKEAVQEFGKFLHVICHEET
jgi:hypothetical protein